MADDPQRNLNRYILRFPNDSLRDRIKRAAAENGRSMNAEIVGVLENHYPPEPDVKEMIDAIETFIGWSENSMAMVRADGRQSLIKGLQSLRETLEREAARSAPPEY